MPPNQAFAREPDEQFERELAALLNRHGLDASVEIPDYILARALYRAIPVFGEVWERIEEAIADAVDQGLVESEVYAQQVDEVIDEYLTSEFRRWWSQVVADKIPPSHPDMPVDFAKALCAMAYDAGRRIEEGRRRVR